MRRRARVPSRTRVICVRTLPALEFFQRLAIVGDFESVAGVRSESEEKKKHTRDQ